MFLVRLHPRHEFAKPLITNCQKSTCVIFTRPAPSSPDANIPLFDQINGHRPPENDSSYRRFPRQIPRMPPCLYSKSARGGAHRSQLLYPAPHHERSTAAVLRTVWQLGSVTVPPFQTTSGRAANGAAWTASNQAPVTSRQQGETTCQMSILISRKPKLRRQPSTPTRTETVQARLIQPHQAATGGCSRRIMAGGFRSQCPSSPGR